IEVLDTAAGEIRLHRLQQSKIFAQRHRNTGGLQLAEKSHEHLGFLGAPALVPAWVCMGAWSSSYVINPTPFIHGAFIAAAHDRTLIRGKDSVPRTFLNWARSLSRVDAPSAASEPQHPRFGSKR